MATPITHKKPINELREEIRQQIAGLGRPGSYSHNIISSALQQIAKEYGRDFANKAIVDYGLEAKGWHQE